MNHLQPNVCSNSWSAVSLQDVLSNLACSEPERAELLALLLKLHNSAAAQLGAAPRHFMAAADLYRATISSKREQLLQQQQFLKVCAAQPVFAVMHAVLRPSFQQLLVVKGWLMLAQHAHVHHRIWSLRIKSTERRSMKQLQPINFLHSASIGTVLLGPGDLR